MSSEFDPYRIWLGIPVSEQPANLYRLLGLALFESDDDVISNAADRQMALVRTFQTVKYSEQSQKLLNELSAARVTLLDKKKKESAVSGSFSRRKTGAIRNTVCMIPARTAEGVLPAVSTNSQMMPMLRKAPLLRLPNSSRHRPAT